jgi:hypothetical protein
MPGLSLGQIDAYRAALVDFAPDPPPEDAEIAIIAVSHAVTVTFEDIIVRYKFGDGRTVDVEMNPVLARRLVADILEGGRQMGWLDDQYQFRLATQM